MPRRRPIASALLTLTALAACSPALNWRQVPLKSIDTTALLPCKPDRTDREVPLGGEPTQLEMAGCEAAGATFALMAVQLPEGRAPDAVLAGWQQATLQNMQAAGEVRRQPFVPAGGLPLAHAQRVAAQGQRADGQAVAAQAVWTARAAPGGGVQLLHAVMYAPHLKPEVADAFFEGLAWRP